MTKALLLTISFRECSSFIYNATFANALKEPISKIMTSIFEKLQKISKMKKKIKGGLVLS